MNITQIVATENGGSRFEGIDIPLDNERVGADDYLLMASETFSSETACFVTLPADLDQDWHQAPVRQLVLVLSGTVEVTTTDAQVRQWKAGGFFIAGDISGRGHKTRVIGGAATVLFLPLDGDGLTAR